MSGYPLKADLLLHRRELALGVMNSLAGSRPARKLCPRKLPRPPAVAAVAVAKKAHLAAALTIRNRDGIAYLRDIDSHENIGNIPHGSSSCDEDRLGLPEQPSDRQCRASHLATCGHTVLQTFGAYWGLSANGPAAPLTQPAIAEYRELGP
jgi:hypothetical protein